MNTAGLQHLTDEHFTDVLIGADVMPATRAHLASCEQCRAEMDRFLSAVGGFSYAAMDWSKSHLSPSPRAMLVPRRRVPFVWTQWALATALVLTVAISGIWRMERRVAAIVRTAAVTATTDSAAQIAQDNRLLQSVNLALNANGISPFSEYHLQEGPGIESRQKSSSHARLRNE